MQSHPPDIRKERLGKNVVTRQQGANRPQKNRVFRPVSRALTDAQRRTEATHRTTKEGAKQLWYLLGNPAYDSPSNPESMFSAEAVDMAKRGRRRTVETSLLGCNNTRRAIRDFEWIARKHGDESSEIERLKGYPTAMGNYRRILRFAKASRRCNTAVLLLAMVRNISTFGPGCA